MTARKRPSSTGSAGGALIVALLVLATAGPYFLGAWLAVRFGADNPSTARTVTGWLFELPWLVVVAVAAIIVLRRRAAYKKALAEYQAARPVPGPGESTVYHHGACTINHRTPESAFKCRKG